MSKKLLLAIALFLFSCFPLHGAQWPEILRRGKLVVAVKDNLRPLGYPDSEGNLQGLEIDIARRLAQELLGSADALVLVPVSNQNCLQVVIDDQVDLAIAGVSFTPARTRIVEFSPFYYLNATGIISNNRNLQQISQLSSSKIAVLENSSAVAVLKYNLPQVSLKGINSYQEALSLLETGQVDGFAGDLAILAGWVQEYPQYHFLSGSLAVYPLAVVMPKGLQYQELRQKVSAAIVRWQREGWLEERAKFWGLPTN
jgi:polar amino acid transport system substrate-binding protein